MDNSNNIYRADDLMTVSTTSDQFFTLPLIIDDNATSMYGTFETSSFLNVSCHDNDTIKTDFIHNKTIQSFLCVLYASIFILGVFGNVLVCYVVLQNRAMQTVTNLFITNLALSDIFLCILGVPFTPLYTFLKRWIFGVPLCHIVPYAQGCSVYISTLTLTSIAIDRFFVIIYPFHPRMKLSTCFGIVICIWIFSLMVTFPYGLYMHIVDMNNTYYCEEHWPSEKARKIFSTTTTTLQFILPFLVIAFCYVCVSFKLNDRARSKPGKKSSKRDEIDRERKKKTNRMLIAMVAIFGVSWFPLNIVNILNDFDDTINCWRYYNIIFFIAHLTAMSSTCYNPFLYAWLNDNFRKEFKQVLPCFNPSHGRLGNSSRWQPCQEERTLNGLNETTQESLAPSGLSKPSFVEGKQLSPIKEVGYQSSLNISDKSHDSGDIILLREVLLPQQPLPPIVTQKSIILPSGVLETPFEEYFPAHCGQSISVLGEVVQRISPTTTSTNNIAVLNLSLDRSEESKRINYPL